MSNNVSHALIGLALGAGVFISGMTLESYLNRKKGEDWLEASAARHKAHREFEYARGRYDERYEINKIATSPEFVACIAKEYNDGK